MIRKVVKHGQTTLTVSLPAKWCRKYGIKDKDEITIEERANVILVKTTKETESKGIKLNIEGYGPVIQRIINSYYKLGCDDFEITFNTPEELNEILSGINRIFIGLEIVEQKKDKIVVKKLAHLEEKQFNSMFRKIFLQIINIGEETIEAIKNNSKNEFKNLIMLDNNINRFCDFCKRTIAKELIPLKKNGVFHFVILEELERIGDEFKKINKYLVKKEVKISKKTIEIFNNINDFFRQMYNWYYNFELKHLKKIFQVRNRLFSDIENHKKFCSKNEIEILYIIYNIVEFTFDMNDLFIMIHSKLDHSSRQNKEGNS